MHTHATLRAFRVSMSLCLCVVGSFFFSFWLLLKRARLWLPHTSCAHTYRYLSVVALRLFYTRPTYAAAGVPEHTPPIPSVLAVVQWLDSVALFTCCFVTCVLNHYSRAAAYTIVDRLRWNTFFFVLPMKNPTANSKHQQQQQKHTVETMIRDGRYLAMQYAGIAFASATEMFL